MGVRLIQLVMASQASALSQARNLVERTSLEVEEPSLQGKLLDLIETIIVYRLPRLTREEIQQVLGFTEIDFRQTRTSMSLLKVGKKVGKKADKKEN